MRGLVTACSAVSTRRLPRRVQSQSTYTRRRCVQVLPAKAQQAWLDPTREEVRNAQCYLSLACVPAMGTVTNLKLAGECPPAVLEEVSFIGTALLAHRGPRID